MNHRNALRKTHRKAILLLLIMIALVSIFPAQASAAGTGGESRQLVDVAYDYPIVPGTAQWNSFTSRDERVAACHVDAELLESMTTRALVETVLTYPMLIDMYAFNTLQEGIAQVSKDFAGISILKERSDAVSCLEQYLASAKQEKATAESIELIYADDLIQYIDVNQQSSLSIFRYTPATLYTPNGSAVAAYKDSTYSNRRTTEEAALAQQKEYLSVYPNTVLLTVANPKYNCHSYAWYSSSPNRYWIENPSPYMQDGSYSSHSAPKIGDKVYWNNGSHSGIVYGVGGGTQNPVTVTSKWGVLGVFRHRTNDCPYSGTVSFWS